MPNTPPEQRPGVAVVYLSWLPYGIAYLDRFLASYRAHTAGLPHRLYILFNGTALSPDLEAFRARAAAVDHVELELASGQDIDAYFFAAAQVKEERILFLNTYSQFTSGNWLKKFDGIYTSGEKIGLVGATASHQSLYSTVFQQSKGWEGSKGFTHNFRKYKLFIKALFYWRLLIPPFPNLHVRTNAFFIARELFLSLKHKKLSRKFDAYLFESGRQSLTRQVLAKGYEARVVDANGQGYALSGARASRTFWMGEQEGALVTDNQTELYAGADEAYRQYLRRISWGDE